MRRNKLYLCFLMPQMVFGLAASAATQDSMVTIPQGAFKRVDGKTVNVDAFSISATEITWSQYESVKSFAEQHGYDFEEGIGQANLPAQNVTWYDAVKWCNALSEISGKTPTYYLDTAHISVYRRGRCNMISAQVKWNADGYRLPTEAEWEHAYRAGTSTTYYWGDYARADRINHEYAVFHVWGTEEIDGGPIPVGSKKPNSLGLFDMAGNVEEWVWDRYAVNYKEVGNNNPRGPDVGPLRVMRGGSFVIDRLFTGDARHPSYPFHVNCDIGFRVASSDTTADGQALNSIAVSPLKPNDVMPFCKPPRVLDVRKDTDAAICFRLLPLLDTEHPNLATVRSAYEEGDYVNALAALRNLYAARLKSSELEPMMSSDVDIEDANRWLEVYREKKPVIWSGPNTDVESLMGFCANKHLAMAYTQTGQQKYADAYLWMLNEAAIRAKPTWNRLTKVEKGSRGKPRDSFYAFIGYDGAHLLEPFTWIASMLKHGLAEEDIPPRTMANALYSAIVDRLPAGLQDDRAAVPNQLWGNAIAIIEFSRLFPELKDAHFLYEEGIARIRRASGTVMPDGTDLEPSLNYNKLLFDDCLEINRLFPDCTAWPSWLVQLNLRTEYRRYMYASLASPFGTFPAVGNQQATDLGARRLLQDWLAHGQLRGLEEALIPLLKSPEHANSRKVAPAFTSIGLPYGGYYVQRSGWTSKDFYLFMRSSRDGVGHNHRDNNNIQVAAHGAWLLVDSGSPAYGPSYLPDHQKKYFHYFGESSLGNVFHANSVAVDGLAQAEPCKRLSNPNRGWRNPQQNLLYHSKVYDVAEGVFDGWYESEQPIGDREMNDLVSDYGLEEVAEIKAYNEQLKRDGERRLRAVHQRLILFVRPEHFWVLVDVVKGGREFTQTWNFPPADNVPDFARTVVQTPDDNREEQFAFGYTRNEVLCSEQEKRIETVSQDRPNIAIMNFTPEAVRYQRHYGQMYPLRGWHSFGITGEKVPAVQVEGTWRGDAPMATVLFPINSRPSHTKTLDLDVESFRDHSHKNISGFSYTDSDITMTFKACRAPLVLSAGPLQAVARVLLVREHHTNDLSGIALDCIRIEAENGRLPLVKANNFEFSRRDGRWSFIPIEAPQAFRWSDVGDGQLRPSYE